MRRARLLLLAAFALPLSAAAQSRIVQLDRPGALEAIAAENPQRHERIVGILVAATGMPCDYKRLERARIEHEASEARCSLMLLTSYPAKRQLSFVLDDTRYVATVTMDVDARLVKVPTGR